MALTTTTKKKVTSTITLSLSRLVLKFTGLVGNTLYGCLEKKKNALDVEDVYSIHTKTQLYQIQQY